MSKRKLKKAYTRTRIKTGNPNPVSKCVQSERRHVDINNIVAKAHKTGTLPVLMGRNSMPELVDNMTYQDALDKVVSANQAFELLPSEIRVQFDNDPKKCFPL